jgi:hypothetical protein
MQRKRRRPLEIFVEENFAQVVAASVQVENALLTGCQVRLSRAAAKAI